MRTVARRQVLAQVEDHVAAIRLCLENRLRMPALALIYCGIDVLANLDRPADDADVTQVDFVRWAERYMECDKSLGVSGLDLYAARCGILHTYGMDSRLSKKGRARPIVYAWGNRSPDGPTKLLQSLGRPEIMIKIESLFSAYQHGIETFGKALDDNPALESLGCQRGRKLFMNQSTFP